MSVAFGDFVFDVDRRELRRGGSTLKVDPLQLDLLAFFIANAGRLLSKQELLDGVWEGRAVADNVLSVTVAKLRKVLGHKPGEREYIENRYGRGYRFLPRVTALDQLPVASQRIARPVAVPDTNSRLVGRIDSLERLEAGWNRARAGSGGLCALIGEPGIGKTRLAETFEQRARASGARVAWGRYQPGSPPLWPFVQVLRELNDSSLAEQILRLLNDRPADASGAAAVDVTLSPEFALSASIDVHRTIDATTQALLRLSQQQPLLILLDDLQWADVMSLRLLGYAIDELSRWPLMIVATVRSTALGSDQRRNRDLSRIMQHRNCERIELSRLAQADVEQYVAQTFGSGHNDVSREVFARSEGNPFFMIELLRPWFGRAGSLDAEQLKLSGLALDLLRQRVQDLPEAVREVLSAAAVIGHDFDLGLLAHVTGQRQDELLETLDGSLANDTVRPSPEIAGAYAFDHELIREVLYADLPARTRCRLHHRAGEALERRRASGADVSSAELAHHFLSALPQGEVPKAIEHARNAAMACKRVGAAADARAILRRALSALSFWVDPDPEVRTALLLELAMAERVAGDGAYLEHLEQAVALARQHGFGSLLMLAGQCLSLAPGLLAHPGAHAVLEAAEEILPASDERGRAIVLAHLTWTPPHCNSAKHVDALLAEAAELAERSQAQDAVMAVQSATLFFRGGPKTLPVAEAVAEAIDHQQREAPLGVRNRSLQTSTFRLITAMQRGDQAAAERAIEVSGSIVDKINSVELTWHHTRLLMVMRMNRGELADVGPELARLREQGQRYRLQAWRAVLSVDLGMLLLRTTDARQFGERIRTSLAPSPYDSPSTRSRKIRSLADFGFRDEVRAALQQISIEALHDLPCDRDYLSVLCNLARAACAAQSTEHASALYELLEAYPDHYAMDISYHCDGSLAHYLAKLALLQGQCAQARAHFEHAAAQNQRMGLLPCLVDTRYELATLLADVVEVRDDQRARELFRETEQLAHTLGMHPIATACKRRLAELT